MLGYLVCAFLVKFSDGIFSKIFRLEQEFLKIPPWLESKLKRDHLIGITWQYDIM